MTALHEAVVHRKFPAVVVLLALQANPNAKDRSGNSPLHLAAYGGHPQREHDLALKLLIKGKPKAKKAVPTGPPRRLLLPMTIPKR